MDQKIHIDTQRTRANARPIRDGRHTTAYSLRFLTARLPRRGPHEVLHCTGAQRRPRRGCPHSPRPSSHPRLHEQQQLSRRRPHAPRCRRRAHHRIPRPSRHHHPRHRGSPQTPRRRRRGTHRRTGPPRVWPRRWWWRRRRRQWQRRRRPGRRRRQQKRRQRQRQQQPHRQLRRRRRQMRPQRRRCRRRWRARAHQLRGEAVNGVRSSPRQPRPVPPRGAVACPQKLARARTKASRRARAKARGQRRTLAGAPAALARGPTPGLARTCTTTVRVNSRAHGCIRMRTAQRTARRAGLLTTLLRGAPLAQLPPRATSGHSRGSRRRRRRRRRQTRPQHPR